MFPTSVQGLVGPLASRLPITAFNLVCTNVPGPQVPLYLLGRKMIHCYPYVPVGGEMAVNCAILTYNGTAHFGFSGDAQAAPDLRKLELLLAESFAELRAAAGLEPPRTQKKRIRPKRRVVKAPAKAKAVPMPARAMSAPVPKPTELKQAPEPAPATETNVAREQLIVA